jgi:hypothetical protein
MYVRDRSALDPPAAPPRGAQRPLASVLRSSACALVAALSACSTAEPPVTQQPSPFPSPSIDPVTPPTRLECTIDTPSTALTPARLLNRFEYDNVVRDLFLLDATDALTPSADFPAENRVSGFDNNAASHKVNPLLVDKLVGAAERVSAYVVERRLARATGGCDVASAGEQACLDRVVDVIAPRAFRRPLTADERTALRTFIAATRATESFADTVRLALQVLLQSPQFLYRLEPGDLGADGSKLVPLQGPELATRLSFFLWGSAPDDALLAAAADGTLLQPAVYRAQVERLLADPRARRVARHFHRMWLKTETLESITKDTATYPAYTPELRDSWLASIDAWVDQSFWVDGKLGAMLKTPQVFADARLAGVLGLPTGGNGLTRHTLDATRYAGLLTQPAIIAALSLPNQSSPIKRGVFVRERLLCQTLAPPPANVAIKPPDPAPGLSTRERFAVHTEAATCAICHVRIDPVGFGLERFDGLGRYRELDNGRPVEDSGELRYLRDASVEGAFTGAVELSKRLADSVEVSDCVATQWLKYALGRDPTAADACSVVNVQTTFAESGGDFRALLIAITETDAFRYRAADVD